VLAGNVGWRSTWTDGDHSKTFDIGRTATLMQILSMLQTSMTRAVGATMRQKYGLLLRTLGTSPAGLQHGFTASLLETGESPVVRDGENVGPRAGRGICACLNAAVQGHLCMKPADTASIPA